MNVMDYLDGDYENVFDMNMVETDTAEDGYFFHPLLRVGTNVKVFMRRHSRLRGKKWELLDFGDGEFAIGVKLVCSDPSIIEDFLKLDEYHVLED